MKFAGSIVILFLIVSASVAEGAKTKTKAIQPLPRTEVRVPAAVKAKMKDLSAVLQMVSITPLVNDSDEVVGMELNEISEMDIINVLKAKNGDVIREVRISSKVNGKMTTTTHSILSVADVMGMYSSLKGASRADVDIKRGKKTVPMSYLLD